MPSNDIRVLLSLALPLQALVFLRKDRVKIADIGEGMFLEAPDLDRSGQSRTP